MAKAMLCLLLLANAAAAQDFNTAKKLFWEELYPTGGKTLYCNLQFRGHAGLDVEHVFAASWMGKLLGCGTRARCRKTSAEFNRMEADLHNLYPALAGVNRVRSAKQFGTVDGERRNLLQCDFESTQNLVEPRPGARGDIARAVLYMNAAYSIGMPARVLRMYGRWSVQDPPSTQERWRNEMIYRLQGNRNPFISK